MRDPREDPRPGDVLHFPGHDPEVHTTRAESAHITGFERIGQWRGRFRMLRSEWPDLARDAEVLHIAGKGATDA